MDIIERTQYSADGGETWHSTEAEARKKPAEAKAYLALAEHFMDNVCGSIIFAIREHPDALIAALRDMGALPEADTTPDVDVLTKAASDGEFHIHDVRYAVAPAVGTGHSRSDFLRGCAHARDAAAGEGAFATSGGAVYAVVPMEQHAKEEAALWKIKDWARYGSFHTASKAADNWCKKHGIDWRDDQ